MDHLDDMTQSDVTVILDKDHYSSKKPNDFEIYSENSDGEEDTVIRMILESQ